MSEVKTKTQQRDELAEKEVYSKICFNGLEISQGSTTYNNCIEAFNLGFDACEKLMQDEIAKLEAELKQVREIGVEMQREVNRKLSDKNTTLLQIVKKQREALEWYGFKIVAASLNLGITDITTATGSRARLAIAATDKELSELNTK